jgi:Uma2 family endonuclease
MSTLVHRKMTADEFLTWSEGLAGRWELHNGVPYRMAPERAVHFEVKLAVQVALLRAIKKAGLECHVLGDGVSVRISQHVLYDPDAFVYCGPKLPSNTLEVSNPVLLVEVASPSTRKFDDTVKRNGYFSLSSVHHYFLVDPDGPPVVHYSRQAVGTPRREEVHGGTLTLAPPGIELAVAELFAMEP